MTVKKNKKATIVDVKVLPAKESEREKFQDVLT
jgi:hypothetical protein